MSRTGGGGEMPRVKLVAEDVLCKFGHGDFFRSAAGRRDAAVGSLSKRASSMVIFTGLPKSPTGTVENFPATIGFFFEIRLHSGTWGDAGRGGGY